jgi:translation initiation factor IF-2
LPLVIKADVQGSVEVLSEMLPKLSDDRVKLKIIHASIGAVTENDVLLASASGAIIVAFNVRPTARLPIWRSAKAWRFARTRSFTKCPTKSRRP